MDNPHPNPAPEWLSGQAWSDLCELDGLSTPFAGLRESLTVRGALIQREGWDVKQGSRPFAGALGEAVARGGREGRTDGGFPHALMGCILML